MPVVQCPPSLRRCRIAPAARPISEDAAGPSPWQPARRPAARPALGSHRRRIAAAFASFALIAALAACEGKLATHGDPIDAVELTRIRPGISTRADVIAALGSPSNVPLFDNNAWYYMSDREQTIAFLAPESIERQVVTIRFDDQGVVSSIDQFGLERGREIDVVSRETPSFGQSPTIIQQMMGNLGRFNKETGPGSRTGTGGGR
jgi:outer membrane protein assembly factor BamE (lipoprotein component of BamABCDE complex)